MASNPNNESHYGGSLQNPFEYPSISVSAPAPPTGQTMNGATLVSNGAPAYGAPPPLNYQNYHHQQQKVQQQVQQQQIQQQNQMQYQNQQQQHNYQAMKGQTGTNPFDGMSGQQQMALVPSAPNSQPSNQWSIQTPIQQQQQQPVNQAPTGLVPVAHQGLLASSSTRSVNTPATAVVNPFDPFASAPAPVVARQPIPMSIPMTASMPNNSMVPSAVQSSTVSYTIPMAPPAQNTMPIPNQMQPQMMQQNQQQQNQQQFHQQPVAAAPSAQPPAPPEEDNTTDDFDFFGTFASAPDANETKSPPASEITMQNTASAANDRHDESDVLSILSGTTDGHSYKNQSAAAASSSRSVSSRKSTNSSSKLSPLDDADYAPAPPRLKGLGNSIILSQHAPPSASPLPDYELIRHSGYVLSRISFRTILMKKWKQSFWIIYGQNTVLFFRSVSDYEDWLGNPYLTKAQRDFLVKLKIDFVEDLYKPNVRGYQVTACRLKAYRNKYMNQFKLERWMDYGPAIAAAFASNEETEVVQLRTLLLEMMKRSPQDAALANNGKSSLNNPFSEEDDRTTDSRKNRYNEGSGDDHNYSEYTANGSVSTPNSKRDSYLPPSLAGRPRRQRFESGGTSHTSPYISSAQSTGGMDDTVSLGSTRSKGTMRSLGAMSTGGLEKTRDLVRDSVRNVSYRRKR